MVAAECSQSLTVGGRRRVEHPHGQRGDRTRVAVAHSNLHLRQAPHHGQLGDALGQRFEQDIHTRNEHGAATHVCDVGLKALAKTDEHPRLGVHVTHTESRAAPIVPGIGGQRIEPALGRHLSNLAQVIHQNFMLGSNLLVIAHVLHHTAAALPEHRARGFHTILGGHEHLLTTRLIEVALAPRAHPLDGLARQRAIHEDGLTLRVGDTAAVVRERADAARHRLP